MAASWLTAQLQVFSSEKPAEVLPVHITLLLDVGSMLTFAQRFERPGDISSSSNSNLLQIMFS